MDPELATDRMQWLAYEPQTFGAGRDPKMVYDDIPFNRSVSRPLHPVCDVSVEGVVELRGHGRFGLRYQSHSGVSKQLIYDVNASTIRDDEDRDHGHFAELEFAFRFERRHELVRFLLAGMKPIELPLEEGNGAGRFLIGAEALASTLSDLVVRRAGYVTMDAPYVVEDFRWNLMSDEFFVLGDNAPVSRDSRHFSPIRRSKLVGIVRRY